MLRSDNLIPLLGGAYQSRAHISDYQICENLFPEVTPQDQEPTTPVVHIPREGKRPLSAPPNPGPGRGVFAMSTGQLYAAVGQNVYSIDRNWTWTQIGQVLDNLTTPVSMSDNGTNAVLVDGSVHGYQISLGTNVLTQINDYTGTFVGSRRVDFADTFFAFAAPGANEWYLSLSNQVAFNALVQANADSNPDPIQTLSFNLRQAWLLKTRGSEVWFNNGATPFPYQEWPNIFVPYGCAAAYSLVRADIDLFWLSRNEQGQAIAVQTKGYAVQAISTRALEYEWSAYPRIDDCIAGTFQQAGHTFILFHFPTADRTWGYDLATKQWHRRTWIDNNGVAHREKVAFYASVGADGGFPPTIVGQDWSTGQIYALDPQYYTDNGQPIVFRRTFPHQLKDMHEITHVSFVADFETGEMPNTQEVTAGASPWSNAFSKAFGPLGANAAWGLPAGPALCMRYSNTGGKTWSNYRQKGLVTAGNYRSMMRFRGLGMARDRVYELLWAYPGPSALNGAYLEPLEHAA